MNPILRQASDAEMDSALRLCQSELAFRPGFPVTGNVHVLGRRQVIPDACPQCVMLRIGMRRRLIQEVWVRQFVMFWEMLGQRHALSRMRINDWFFTDSPLQPRSCNNSMRRNLRKRPGLAAADTGGLFLRLLAVEGSPANPCQGFLT